MDRYLTTLSPKKSSALSKEPSGPLADVLGLNDSRILIPQSPKKLSPQKRSPQRLINLTESDLNSDPSADTSRLILQCIVKSTGLRDDFYSTLLAAHPLKPQLAIGVRSSVQYWSCQFGHDFAIIPTDMGHIMCMAYTSKGLLVVGYSVGVLLLYNHEIECVLGAYRFEDTVFPSCVATNDTNNHVYVGTSTGDLAVLDVVTVYRTRFEVIKHPTRVATDIISGIKSNGKVLAVGSNDGSVTLWDTTGSPTQVGQVKHKAAVKSIEFVPNQPFFITGGGRADRCINVWSLRTFELRHRFEVPGQVTGLIWVGRNELFVGLGHAKDKKQVVLGEIWRIERGASKRLVVVEDKSQPARAVHTAKCQEGLVVGTNTNKLYYFGWKEREVGGFGLAKNLHLSPLR